MLTGAGEVDQKKLAYNAGTGVIPAYRGRRWVRKMYEWAEPRWRAEGVTDLSLEVIVENEKAIRAYQSVGFRAVRRLLAFKWEAETAAGQTDFLAVKNTPNWPAYQALQPFTPSWDYNQYGVSATQVDYQFVEWRGAETLRAYAIIHQSGRIAQAGCRENTAPEWQRFLLALQRQYSVLSWINIDARAKALLTTLKKKSMATHY